MCVCVFVSNLGSGELTDDRGSGSSAGLIAGVVIGLLAVAVCITTGVLVGLGVTYRRKKKRFLVTNTNHIQLSKFCIYKD